jgi:hypothetical protein
MRKTALALALLATTAFSGCTAGPHQLCRTVDDWDQKLYVGNPWLGGVMSFTVIPLAKFGAGIGDFFVGDAYTFWVRDAWSGKGGAGFKHYNVEHTDGAMSSLLNEDGKYLEIK